MTTPRQVLEQWLVAMNSRDAQAYAALYHEDAVNHQVATGAPWRGRQEIFDNAVALFTAFPDTFTHAENIFEDGEWAILEWSGGGTFLREFGGHPPNGRSFTLVGCGFFRVVEGKIVFQRGYFDNLGWFAQLGISPPC